MALNNWKQQYQQRALNKNTFHYQWHFQFTFFSFILQFVKSMKSPKTVTFFRLSLLPTTINTTTALAAGFNFVLLCALNSQRHFELKLSNNRNVLRNTVKGIYCSKQQALSFSFKREKMKRNSSYIQVLLYFNFFLKKKKKKNDYVDTKIKWMMLLTNLYTNF